jgi:hypothetical protein
MGDKEIPELKEIEIVFNGEDIAALMIMSCEGIVTGLATLLNILQRRGIPDSDPEVIKMHNDYYEYLERLETAIGIQQKLREMKDGTEKPQPWEVGYG